MEKVPSLFSLCVETITTTILRGYDGLENVFELPPDLLGGLLRSLPSLALQRLHEISINCSGWRGFAINSINEGRKRARCEDFNIAWKALFEKRWPENVDQMTEHGCRKIGEFVNYDEWQQLYWEKHLQNCLDEASERALLPSFDGRVGELIVPENIMKSIGQSGATTNDCSKLVYNCNKFGRYARRLSLQNVLCVRETCDLLRESKLQALVFRRIFSKSHVSGLRMLLDQNKETLVYLELIDCRLPSSTLNQICSIFYKGATETHELEGLSFKASSIFESGLLSVPTGLLSFLSSARSLKSLYFCDTRMGPFIAKAIFHTLINSSCELLTLDMSDNNIAGWLSKVDRISADSSLLGSAIPVKSLCVLNLRGNNLSKGDLEDLNRVLVHMPNLRSLDISDNPIEDDGLRSLIPYFMKALLKSCPLLDIKLDNCGLSGMGVTELLSSLPSLKEPLNTLSLADNDLGSSVAAPLAKMLGITCVKVLNIEDIGLGPMGFQELVEKMPTEIALVSINISKNRGGERAACFISKVICEAPDIAAINAGYNFMPPESSRIIYDALEQSKGKLQHLDLTGNARLCNSIYTEKLLEFHSHRKPIVVIPSLPTSSTPYDDDP